MTNEDLLREWKDCEITSPSGQRARLKDLILLCGKFMPIPGTLFMDTGGEQGSDAYIVKMHDDGEALLCVNPDNQEETNVLGKLSRITE